MSWLTHASLQCSRWTKPMYQPVTLAQLLHCLLTQLDPENLVRVCHTFKPLNPRPQTLDSPQACHTSPAPALSAHPALPALTCSCTGTWGQ
jgi:hypothetical protein